MNFQTVYNANGAPTIMFGTLTNLGQTKSGQKGNYQSARLKDDTGQERPVTVFQGQGQLLSPQNVGQRLQFSLKTYQGKNGVGLSGYWNDKANVSQPPQNSPPAQQPQPTTKVVSEHSPDERRRYRGMCLSYCKDLIVADKINKDDMYAVADTMVKFIYDEHTETDAPNTFDDFAQQHPVADDEQWNT